MKKVIVLLSFFLLMIKIGEAEEWVKIDKHLWYNSKTVQRAVIWKKEEELYWVEIQYRNEQEESVGENIYVIDINRKNYWPLRMTKQGGETPRVYSESFPLLLERLKNQKRFTGKPFVLKENVDVDFGKHTVTYFLASEGFSNEMYSYFTQTFVDSKGDHWYFVRGKLQLNDAYIDLDEIKRWDIQPAWFFYGIINTSQRQGWIFQKDSPRLKYVKIEKEEFEKYFG